MGKKSRDKGASFERQIAARFREYYPRARRRGNAQSDGMQAECDVEGTRYWIECKRYAKAQSWNQLIRWLEESMWAAQSADTNRPGIVIYKWDRQPIMVLFFSKEHGAVTQPLCEFLGVSR